ncbi:hypothetical protein M5G22_25890 [Pseudomonas sp. TNT2022 ID233]|uniref:hypothetical protein n=1 Tax=Pseudomonas aphyarum TaxID=2942629 RepID=UPI002362A854|nr:hypothetical protein [Pseudomonas aphyarum]MDD1141007.1 hypothetical protein [Pseudomonas aphyarum]
MLVTYAQAEVPLGLMAGKSEIRHWRYAELSFASIWLYVSIGYVRSGLQRQCTLLMPELREFEQLLNDCGDALWIDDVMVVSPGDVNDSGAWMMERLVALEEAVDKQTGEFVYIYVLDNGRRYTESELIQSDELQDQRVLYQR